MIVKLWAQQVIDGKRTFSSVPSKLKDKVAAYLREQGHDDLVTE